MAATDKSAIASFNVQRVLEAVALLKTLSSKERKALASQLEERVFEAGEALMTEGEEGDEFYIIVTGKVDVSTKSGGKIASLQAGDYAGEQALLKSGSVRNASLTATEHTITLVCTRTAFKKHIEAGGKVRFAKREAKRNAFMTAIDDDIKLDDPKTVKTDEQIKWLLECVSSNLLFATLDREQSRKVIDHMELVDVVKDTEVIAQGDEHGHTFYVVESGTYTVHVDGVKVHQYERSGTFGELALLYDAPRAASVIATENGKLWEVDRKAFRYEVTVAARRKQHDLVEFLTKVPLFQPLLKNELDLVADALEPQPYRKGDVIFKEGDIGDKFFVVYNGQVEWSKKDGEKGAIEPTGVFGERALHTKDKRAATITAVEDTVLLELAATDFHNLLGPVMDFVDDMVKEYHRSAAGTKEAEAAKEKRAAREAEAARAVEEHAAAGSSICDLGELKTLGVLGKGGFGLVTLVEDPKSKKTYALKAIRKFQVIEYELTKHIVSEKKVMDMMSSPFLVNLHKTYKDELRVYFLLDACLGGELFTILRRRRYFDEKTAQFFAACVVEAFDYMHSMDIIYRDLKPENLVLDERGYCKVADFGFAKVVKDKTFTLCGTPDYLCPEIVTSQGHGKGCDWWTLGVLIYEMLASFAPFAADDPIDTYRKIIRGKIAFPRFFTPESRDLIKGLMNIRPTRRLGVLRGGADNIRRHVWFKKLRFDWKKMQAQTLKPPIIPKVKDARDLSCFAEVDVGDDSARPIRPSQEFDECF